MNHIRINHNIYINHNHNKSYLRYLNTYIYIIKVMAQSHCKGAKINKNKNSCEDIMDKDGHVLHTEWTLWYHVPNDKKWDKESYKKIIDITTIEDYWRIHNYLKAAHLENGMYFLMRKNILPMWEDSHNKNGGSWSFKIDKKDIYNMWIELSIAVLGECMMNDEKDSKIINGITTSPKKGFCIVKIWNSDKKQCSKSLLKDNIQYVDLSQCIYKSHI